jgi:ATP-dependent exoDNAse (exonuclease V) beta subunit
MDDRAADEAGEMALAALANPDFNGLLAASATVHREVPFAVPLERLDLGGAAVTGLVEGSIDLLLLGPEGALVLDYKTDRVEAGSEADLAERYWPQLGLYALAVSACTGDQAPEIALFFVRTGKLLRRSVDEALARGVASLVANLRD